MWFVTTRLWNKTLNKTLNGCSNCHSNDKTSYFYYWSKDDSYFNHCCSLFTIDHIHENNISGQAPVYKYIYSLYGPKLQYADYYDLGLIDKCLPYWKYTDLFQGIYDRFKNYIQGECIDVQHLYSCRVWSPTILKYGLLQSVLPFIMSLEILVVYSLLFAINANIFQSIFFKRQGKVGVR